MSALLRMALELPPAPLATIVDWGALAQTALAALVGGLVVTVAASTAIYGFASFAEARRGQRAGAAALGAGLAAIGILAFAAAIAIGLIVMISG